MTRTLLSLVGLGVAVLVGCEKSASTAPGTNPSKPDEVRKLTLRKPSDIDIARNGTEKITVHVDRDNFKGPVEVSLKDLPAGVSVVTPEMTIPEGKDNIEVTLKAAPEAKLTKDHQVKVTAKAQDIKEVSEVFKVEVKEK